MINLVINNNHVQKRIDCISFAVSFTEFINLLADKDEHDFILWNYSSSVGRNVTNLVPHREYSINFINFN